MGNQPSLVMLAKIASTIYADHIGMTKFSTTNDPGYKKVLYAIEMLLQEPLTKDQPTPAEPKYVQIVHYPCVTRS